MACFSIVSVFALSVLFAACGATPEEQNPPPPGGSSNEVPVCVMSYNLRVADMNNATYGDRRARVAEFILREMPDSFGVQEASPEWLTAVSERVGEYYECVGSGRESDGTGEASAVFYRKDKFRLLETETKWLSPTPDVAGSAFPGEQYKRIVTYAVLQSKTSDVTYVHANTHLGLTAENRLQQVGVLMELLADYAAVYPTFVTGDFNDSAHDNAAYEMGRKGYFDARVEAEETDSHWTFPTPMYSPDPSDEKIIIDYCFHNGLGVDVDRYRVITEANSDGGWSSDHYPIVVRGKIKPSENGLAALNSKIETIEFADNFDVRWREDFDSVDLPIVATLKDGNRIPIPSYLCRLEKPTGRADLGTYKFSAFLKSNEAIKCSANVNVRAVYQAEDALLYDGASSPSTRTNQIEFEVGEDGTLIDFGKRVTYVGGMDNAVSNGKRPLLSFVFDAKAGDYTLNVRCSNTWWTFKTNSGTSSEVDISRVLKLNVNGNTVTVKASVLPAVTGEYAQIGRTFFTLEMADVTLKSGKNTVVIEGFNDGYDVSEQRFNEAPVPNIDYIEFVGKS